MLCKLLNKLQPGLITQNVKPETIAFKQMQTVEYFLKGCRAYGAQLDFTPDDLVNCKDVIKVIGAIHYLGEIVTFFEYICGLDSFFLKAESKGFEPAMTHTANEFSTMKRKNSLKREVETKKREKRLSSSKG